jgi:hypothetical protein
MLPGGPAFAGNPPVGGGGTCTSIIDSDATEGAQEFYDSGLYTCHNGSSWVAEAIIVGNKLQDGTTPSCNATHKGMIRWDGTHFAGCNGTTWLNF